MNSRIDGRGVSRSFAHTTDRIGVNETAPGGASTPSEGLTGTPVEEVPAMQNRSHFRKQIALEHLALAKREFDTAVESRIRYILLAREYGNTNAEIGAVLGVGESSVRAMVKRHGDAA